MSTDYVFDGVDPPYATDATPHPLSTYGEQKVAGEQMCLEKCPASVVFISVWSLDEIVLLYIQVELQLFAVNEH